MVEFNYDISDLTSDKESSLYRAAVFSFDAHGLQKRKYTNEPYIEHPIAVARLIRQYTDDENTLIGALLHDVVEDTPVNLATIYADFGAEVGNIVASLTDFPIDGTLNRIKRKALDRQRLASASSKAKTVKIADIINNAVSIVNYDPNFARIFLSEVDLLMEFLVGGNSELYELAIRTTIDCRLALMRGIRL